VRDGFVPSAQLLHGLQRHDRDAKRVVRDDLLDRATGVLELALERCQLVEGEVDFL
jgi:hypothetical protein